jgi:hypothetical protein
MNTNNIKSFAKEARLLLLDGVFQRLKYWGFQEDGANTENIQTTQGGYIFRSTPYSDVSVPPKWHKLKAKLKNKQNVKDVIEEASYTWFNRLMAIKILEANGYIPKQLGYTEGSRTPLIVQNAKRGEHNITNRAEKELLIEFLKEDKDEEAFALLITNLCHTNTLLHDIFGCIDDYTEILFPQNVLKIDGLLDLINSDAIIDEDFKEVELIGWLYQFYISDKKDEVFKGFKKNIKARAEDIPAATQIFTPKWIVKYMVENTVGKIYLDFEPDSDLRDQMKYLVQNESEDVIASETKQSLITDLTQLTLIDPAAGSGHILVTGFELLFKMYREAGYNAEKSVQNILQHNLYGLDIDDRAMQLARFAVLLKAAQYDAQILEDPIMPQIYSFPEDTLGNLFTNTYYSKSQSNWHDLLGMQLAEPVSIEWEETKKGKSKTKKVTFKEGEVLNEAIVDLLELHCDEAIATDYSQELELFWGDYEKPHNYSELFYAIKLLRQGKNLGSAIKLNISSEVYTHINDTYQNWLLKESTAQLNIEETSIFNLLKPFLDVFLVLANQYKAVVANPPYLGYKFLNDKQKQFLEIAYPNTKSDLFAVFQEVISNLGSENALRGIINQWAWMCIDSYKDYRYEFLKLYSVDSILHLGIGVFKELNTKKVQNVALVFTDKTQKETLTSCYRLDKTFDLSKKEKLFLNKENEYVKNLDELKKIPSSPLAFWFNEYLIEKYVEQNTLEDVITPRQGLATGDNDRFVRNWHEVNYENISEDSLNKVEALESNKKWFPYNKGGGYNKWYGNNFFVVNWENDGKEIKNNFNGKGKLRSRPQNEKFYFKEGVTWSLISLNFSARYTRTGYLFDVGGSSGFPAKEDLYYSIALLNSKISSYILNGLNFTLNVQVGDIKRILFLKPEKEVKSKIDNLCKELIDISKLDFDSSELSRDFNNHILINNIGENLKSSFKNTESLIYNLTNTFFKNEKEINTELIKLYSLEQELDSLPDLKFLTIFQDIVLNLVNDNDDIIPAVNKEFIVSSLINYFIGVFLGRYRLDKPGLNIAHPNPTEQELSSYQYNGQNITIDDDGIVPLMGEDCAFPDDALTRTKDLLLAIWGENALTENINFLREALGLDLHKWLTEKFWGYHTSMYKKKPIYWLFSSNVKKPQIAAFKVLVYMHRMDKYTVQQIQRNYLYPHQEYIKNEIDKLTQEEDSLNREQQKRLELLRDWELECRDYNEVLKTLANQQIEIDLDDGVTVNYAKFEGAVAVI